jgi:hypothetical protein
VDSSVKVEYLTPKKFTSVSGFFTKTEKHLIKKSITIKNEKREEVILSTI